MAHSNLLQTSKPLFRDYDIRGDAELISAEFCRAFAPVFASFVIEQLKTVEQIDQITVVVGRDGRLSSPRIADALITALVESGVSVIDIGLCPTPLCYFAQLHYQADACLMITGSHNPAAQNGIKMVVAGQALQGSQIKGLYKRMEKALGLEKPHYSKKGLVSARDVSAHYLNALAKSVDIDLVSSAELSVIVDCGNGAAGVIAEAVFQVLGVKATFINLDVDGEFPNHPPDPSRAENLQQLQKEVEQLGADLGIAFDGDADRTVIVANDLVVVSADKLAMLFCSAVQGSVKNKLVAVVDIKTSSLVAQHIDQLGGEAYIAKTGHSNVKQQMRKKAAHFGCEHTGHFCFADRWYGFDDGIYAATRVLEILALKKAAVANKTLGDLLELYPSYLGGDEVIVAVDEEKKFEFVAALISAFKDDLAKGWRNELLLLPRVTTLDGLRVDFENGWFLIRPSNTSAALTLRFEAIDEQSLAALYQLAITLVQQLAANFLQTTNSVLQALGKHCEAMNKADQ